MAERENPLSERRSDPTPVRAAKVSDRPAKAGPSARPKPRSKPPSKPPTPKPKLSVRLRRLGGGLLGGALSTLVFVSASVAGFVLHIDLPAERRVLASSVDELFARTMQGRLRVNGIKRISPRHIEVESLHLTDARQREVVTLTGVRLRANFLDLAWDAAFGGAKTTLVINHIRAERTVWEIVPDINGDPSLVGAMSPLPSEPSATPSSAPARYFRVWIPNIELGRSFVRGSIGDLPVAEVSLSSARGSLLATPKGLAIDVQRFGATLRGVAGADAVGTGDLHIRSPGAVWGGFNGALGEVQVGAFFKTHAGRLEARLELPRAEAPAVRALYADWPIQEPVTARIDASGTLPKLDAKGAFSIGDATIDADGTVRLGEDLGAKLNIKAKHVDLRSILPDSPQTDVDATATVEIWNRDGDVVVDVNGSTKPTVISGIEIPLADWNGSFDKYGFRGKTNLHETGIPIRADFTIHPSGRIDLEAHARRFALRDSPRLRPFARGFLDVSAKGSITAGQLSATVTATGDHLAYSSASLSAANLTGVVSGPLTQVERIHINSTLRGSGLSVSGTTYDRVRASAVGLLVQPQLGATLTSEYKPKIIAKAKLSPPIQGSKRTRFSGVRVSVAQDDAKLVGTADYLDITAANRVNLQKVTISGAGGKLTGGASITSRGVRAQLVGADVELDVIARALGLPKRTLEGRFSIDADVDLRGDDSKGRVAVRLGNASILGLEGISARADATLNRGQFDGRGQVTVDQLGNLGSQWELSLGGDPLLPASWLEATGNAEFNTDRVQLTGLELQLRNQGVDAVRGQAKASVQLNRTDPKALPSALFVAGTEGLDVRFHTDAQEASKDGSVEAKERKDYHLQDFDFQTSGAINGKTGDIQASARLIDGLGELFALSGAVKVDLDRLIAANRKQAVDMLRSAPLDVRLNMAERKLAELPPDFRPVGLDGSVGGELRVHGSAAVPMIEASAFTNGFRPQASRLAQAFDASARARYNPNSGDVESTAELKIKSRRVALAKIAGNARWSEIVAGRSLAEDWWQVGATVRLEDLPLEAFSPFADQHIQARLNGSLSAQRAKGKALVVANVDVASPVLDRVSLGRGTINFRSDNEKADLTLRLADQKGNLEANLRTGLQWVDLLPSLDSRAALRVDLQASNYDAVVLQPFVDGLLTQIGGRVDANFRALIVRESAEATAEGQAPKWLGTLAGQATLREGTMQITSLGLGVEDVRLGVTATSDGKGTSIELSSLKGKVRSGVDNVEGGARLYLSGLELARGAGWLKLDSVPLLLEGVSQGTGTGYATFRMEKLDEGMRVDVTIPRLEARLPRLSSRSVYDIEDNPDIEVAQLLREPQKPSSDTPTLWVVPITLGPEVRITRTDMEIYVRGEPTLRMQREVSLDGFVELVPGGRIPALGKAFVVERGLVSFDTGDPTNPHVNATASLRAADSTVIYVDLTGTLKRAELKLRSDPPLPEPEIIALMLGGVSTTGEDTSSSSNTADGGSSAVNLGGGVAAIGINELLADSLGGVELRTDGTSNAAPSYTAAYRASSKVYVEGTYQSADNAGIDDSVKEGVSGTVDFRFLPNWSLRTQIGTTGTALDLIWQYRY